MTDWRAQGRCVDSGVDFHDPAQEAQALVLCRSCPVQPTCLQEALDNEEEWGVWGGTNPGQRRRLLAGPRPRPCVVCGARFLRSSSTQLTCSEPCRQRRAQEMQTAYNRRRSVA